MDLVCCGWGCKKGTRGEGGPYPVEVAFWSGLGWHFRSADWSADEQVGFFRAIRSRCLLRSPTSLLRGAGWKSICLRSGFDGRISVS
jgi:hypothetical protein